MTYRPGDVFTRKLPLTDEGVSVSATVERNGSVVAGTGISSTVSGQICTVTLNIPSEWAARDFVRIILTATLEDETSYEVIEFRLESKMLSDMPAAPDLSNLATSEQLTDAQAAITDAIAENVGDMPEQVARIDTNVTTLVNASGTGANLVTVTVTDGTGPLENAAVRLTEGVSSYTATTSADGIATFGLDAATYTRSITKAGYQFTPDTITVDAGHTEFEAAMTAHVAIPGSTLPEYCVVYFDFAELGLSNVEGHKLTAQLSTQEPVFLGDEVVPTNSRWEAVSDEDGIVSLTLPYSASLSREGTQGVKYKISCPGAGIPAITPRLIEVPSTPGPVNIKTLL